MPLLRAPSRRSRVRRRGFLSWVALNAAAGRNYSDIVHGRLVASERQHYRARSQALYSFVGDFPREQELTGDVEWQQFLIGACAIFGYFGS